MVAAVSFWAQQHAKQDLIQYLSHHKSEIEERQIMDLQVAHRRQVLALKSEHSNEIRQLNGNIRTVNAKFDRLDGEYNWMSDTYQEQTRLVHEQEDRIAYLEGKLHEFGQTTPNTRQPFSAPPSQIRFNNPPRRTRYDSAAGASSPLANVSTLTDSCNDTPTYCFAGHRGW
jgi:chromosome segregation ATPase